jgi:hypothetical protein
MPSSGCWNEKESINQIEIAVTPSAASRLIVMDGKANDFSSNNVPPKQIV